MKPHRVLLSLALTAGLLPTGCATPSTAKTPATQATAAPEGTACAWTEPRVARRPVLVLREMGGWGPDGYPQTGTPTFTLHDDGLVVYATGTNDDSRAWQTRLSAEETEAMVKSAEARLADLPDDVKLSTATDQPSILFELGNGRRVFVWGIDRKGEATSAPSPHLTPPAGMVELYLELQSFSRDGAEPWQPDELQVSMYRHVDYEGPTRSWPQWLPRPPANSRRPSPKKYVKDVERIFYRVGPEFEERLAAFDEETVPVEVDGEIWFVHYWRVPPAEL